MLVGRGKPAVCSGRHGINPIPVPLGSSGHREDVRGFEDGASGGATVNLRDDHGRNGSRRPLGVLHQRRAGRVHLAGWASSPSLAHRRSARPKRNRPRERGPHGPAARHLRQYGVSFAGAGNRRDTNSPPEVCRGGNVKRIAGRRVANGRHALPLLGKGAHQHPARGADSNTPDGAAGDRPLHVGARRRGSTDFNARMADIRGHPRIP